MSDELPAEVRPFFPYPEPRTAQVQGIDQVRQTARINGFFMLEGACGSGKTMLSLSPLIEQVRRDDTDYERVLVITSVKQQLRAFEEAVRDINQNLPDEQDNISALTLTGKADVHPYVRSGEVDKRDVYTVSEDLRDATRDLVNDAGNSPDEKRSFARRLYREAESDGYEFPYPGNIPRFETDAGEQVQYSPYYAKYLAARYSQEMDSPGPSAEAVVPFSPTGEGMVTPEDLVDLAGREYGTSPHAVMGDLLDDVEVVVANYYHVFDQQTVDQFTSDLLGEETLLVVDEAHNLVPRVRKLLGTSVSFSGFQRAANELEEVSNWLTGETTQTEAARETAISLFDGAPGIGLDDMEAVQSLLETMDDRIGRHVEKALSDELGPSWEDNPSRHKEMEVALRDPSNVEDDKLSQWLSLAGKKSLAKQASGVLELAFLIRSEVYEKHFGYTRLTDSSLTAVGDLLSAWVENDNASFFREVELEPAEYDRNDTTHAWQKHFRAELAINNCLPRDRIADRLDVFGAGVLMSATLAPFDIFRQVTGLDRLEEEGRPVIQRRYGLPFPEENRESVIVDAPSYRYNNRGRPEDSFGNPNLDNDVRRTYADIILDTVETTDGNVLVSMPSYSEANWAGRVLEMESSVKATDILIDESSSDRVTEELKQSFFEGDQKVLVTAARGTLVEGVDYKDEKLDGVVVIGVPLESTQGPYQTAIRTAYQERFGYDNGFEYAFSLPAVYKARQSLGRAIRTHDDLGVRVLADERYREETRNEDMFGNVREFLPDDEKQEYDTIQPAGLGDRLDAFWSSH